MMKIKAISYLLLLLICAAVFSAVLPTISRNMSDSNLSAYFNHDEAHLFGHLWYYYSGQKLDSFQYENDYGVELLYLAALCRTTLARFVNFTPEVSIAILRWLNLIFWIASLIAAWCLFKRHFGNEAGALLVVVLLAVRPALPRLAENSKPESLVLFLMVLGLYNAISMLNRKNYLPYLYAALACASLATLIKFAGIFLLAPILFILNSVRASRADGDKRDFILKLEKAGWALPAFMGMIFIALPIAIMLFYVRQSSGLTWYREFGFWNCILKNRFILASVSLGAFLLALSCLLWLFNRLNENTFKKSRKAMSIFMSQGMAVMLIFVLFSAVFGMAWIIKPLYFIQVCATNAAEALNLADRGFGEGIGLPFAGPCKFAAKIMDFDPLFFFLFIFAIALEIYFRKKNIANSGLQRIKGMSLVVFVLPVIFFMMLDIRITHHHMLPFFLGAVMLVIADIGTWIKECIKKPLAKYAAIMLMILFVSVDIIWNARASAETFSRLYRQDQDVVFDIMQWWKENYAVDTVIVADHPTLVYVPREFRNVKYLKYQRDRARQLGEYVLVFHPRLLYLNMRPEGYGIVDGLERSLAGKINLKKVATFNNEGRAYGRHPNSQYVVYEVLYGK